MKSTLSLLVILSIYIYASENTEIDLKLVIINVYVDDHANRNWRVTRLYKILNPLWWVGGLNMILGLVPFRNPSCIEKMKCVKFLFLFLKKM